MSKKYHYIHEKGDYIPLAVEEIGSAWATSIKKTVGYNESPCFFIYQNGWCRIYSYEEVHQKIIAYVFKKINQDKNYVKKAKEIFDQRAKKVLDFVERINQVNWKEITSEELIKIKEEYVRLYHETVPYGEPLPYFLKEKLQEVLGKYLIEGKKVGIKEYETLVTPLYRSFLNREEKELYELAQKYPPGSKEFLGEIKKHQKKYVWLLFDYASLTLDEKYFREKAKELIEKSPKFTNYKKVKQQKQQIIKKYKISLVYRSYLDILEDLFYLMDKKKEVLTQAHFAITSLYEEAGRRLGFSLEEIRFVLWKDVKDALRGKTKLTLKKINARKKFSVIKFHEGTTTLLNPPRGKKLVLDIKKDEAISKDVREIKGMGASVGKARGVICYLKSAKENSKIKEGEILLVSNTTPDFMPAIRKAAAIITNEGGITCHAAIVSRELKIPCIVGTTVGTKVLEDGDEVEVNADDGIVKIIKRIK